MSAMFLSCNLTEKQHLSSHEACTCFAAATGMPRLRGAFRYNPHTQQLQLALRQQGSSQVIKAGLRARAALSQTDSTWGVLKVAVREIDSMEEAVVQLGPEEPLALVEYKVGGWGNSWVKLTEWRRRRCS